MVFEPGSFFWLQHLNKLVYCPLFEVAVLKSGILILFLNQVYFILILIFIVASKIKNLKISIAIFVCQKMKQDVSNSNF